MKMIINCKIRNALGYLLEWKLEGDVPTGTNDRVLGFETSEFLKRIWDMEQAINNTGIRAHISIED